ncbi:MAG: NTP transferase domain-containing protein [Candidatus Limnocylindrales bacterium]
MTVAAVILAATPESALADAAGRPAARRIVETAWAGGAVPIIVVAPERDGAVAASLAGSGATLAEPAPSTAGPVGQILRGMTVTRNAVTETDAAFIWPADMVWVDAETITSLIQAHGLDEAAILRPTWHGEPGWPVLVPLERMADLAVSSPTRMPDELVADLVAAGVPIRLLDMGDPGATHDRDTPIADLPEYEGPAENAGRPAPEWGAAAADRAEDTPLEGPALAPYEPA